MSVDEFLRIHATIGLATSTIGLAAKRQRCCASEDAVRQARRHDDESGGFLASIDAALLHPTGCTDAYRSVCRVACAVSTQVQREVSSSTAIISSSNLPNSCALPADDEASIIITEKP